jgi:hypothetical protein
MEARYLWFGDCWIHRAMGFSFSPELILGTVNQLSFFWLLLNGVARRIEGEEYGHDREELVDHGRKRVGWGVWWFLGCPAALYRNGL